MRKKKTMIVCAVVLVLIGFVLAAIQPLILVAPLFLTGQYTGVRSQTEFDLAHSRAVRSFVKSRGFGLSRLRHKSFFNEDTIVFQGVGRFVYRIELVGLTEEHGERYFQSTRPPLKKEIPEWKSRALTIEESAACAQLESGAKVVEIRPRLNDISDAVRLLAPIFASEGCEKCHDSEPDQLLGALAYTLSYEH